MKKFVSKVTKKGSSNGKDPSKTKKGEAEPLNGNAKGEHGGSPGGEESDQLETLQAMFADLDERVIRSVFREASYDMEQAIDTLLNLQAISVSGGSLGNVGNSDPHIGPLPPRSPPQVEEVRQSEAEVRNRGVRLRASSITKLAVKTLKGKEKKEDKTEKKQGELIIEPQFSDFTSIDEQLLQAARDSNIPMVEHFMKEIKPFLARNIRPLLTSCLLIIIEQGNVELLRLFLKNGAPPDGLDDDETKITPLILALESGQEECAFILLQEFKANPNKSSTNLSPLHIATKYKYSELVKLLVKSGAHVNRLDPETGKTALHMAIEGQDYDIVAGLLESNAEIGLRDNVQGETPLHFSIRTSRTTKDMMIVCLLLEKAKETGVALNMKTVQNGDTALHLAVQRCKGKGTYMADLVLRFSPDCNVRNNKGMIPLDIAKANQNEELISKLSAVPQSPPPLSSLSFDDEEEEVSLVRKKNPLSLSANEFEVSNGPKPNSPNPLSRSGGIVTSNSPNPLFRNPPPNSASHSVSHSTDIFHIANTGPTGIDEDYLVVESLEQYIQQMIQTNGFETEFGEIEEETANANLVGDFTSALQPHNIRKNRYKNILPLEQYRVKLQEDPQVEGSDYFSGSYISGETPGSEKMYIATQGPLQHTSGDFWQMIWEQKCKVIVMLANVIENGKEKCFSYWPEGLPLEFPKLRIAQVKEEEFHDYVVRTFEITHKETNGKATVVQIQYIAWPDQGLPGNTDG